MNRKEMKSAVENIVIESIEAAKMEAAYNDRAVTLSDYINEVEVTLMSISFDTKVAKSMFKGICIQQLESIDPQFKQHVQPKMGMDQNGNWTTNKSIWA